MVSKLIKINQNYSKLIRPCGLWIEPAKICALMAGLASSSARPAGRSPRRAAEDVERQLLLLDLAADVVHVDALIPQEHHEDPPEEEEVDCLQWVADKDAG